MSGQSEPIVQSGLWDFALAFYKLPGVEADCLTAQDRFGMDVTLLIFALYRAKQGLGFNASTATELARTLSSKIVEPLRRVRADLKSLPDLVNKTNSEALRQAAKAIELDAERLTLLTLDALPTQGEHMACEAALLAIAKASSLGEDLALGLLLKRLALAAQNM